MRALHLHRYLQDINFLLIAFNYNSNSKIHLNRVLAGPEGLGVHYFSAGYNNNVTWIITDYHFLTLISVLLILQVAIDLWGDFDSLKFELLVQVLYGDINWNYFCFWLLHSLTETCVGIFLHQLGKNLQISLNWRYWWRSR